MTDVYPRWDVTDFLNSEARVCSYLQAAAEDDVGRGDTIRLAWRDILSARDTGKITLDVPMNSAGLSSLLKAHGIGDRTAGKIACALRRSFPRAA